MSKVKDEKYNYKSGRIELTVVDAIQWKATLNGKTVASGVEMQKQNARRHAEVAISKKVE